MIAHWKYLKYVIKHKMYVFLACLELGVPLWIATFHDWDKFLPDEWIPYARYFYGDFMTRKELNRMEHIVNISTDRMYSKEDLEQDFNVAWLKHLHRNKHHPQHWVLVEDSGEIVCLEMPQVYALEMCADWKGASLAQGNNLLEWYAKNKNNIRLHPNTRIFVEQVLGIEAHAIEAV